jgi:hypothetical protein
MTKTSLILAALLLFAECSFANTVILTLDTPSVTAVPGDSFVITGILTNTAPSTVDLNFISFTLDGMFQTDITPFFNGPLTIDPSGQSVDFGLVQFTVLSPYTDPPGIHTGTITILGGIEGPGGYDANIQNVLGSADFQVNVQAPVVAPEPASASLCAAATTLLFLLRRRASRRRAG